MYTTKESFFDHLDAVFDYAASASDLEGSLDRQESRRKYRANCDSHDHYEPSVLKHGLGVPFLPTPESRRTRTQEQSGDTDHLDLTEAPSKTAEETGGKTSRTNADGSVIPLKRARQMESPPRKTALFSDMVFYFIPASRVNVARALRMEKVEQLGGRILKSFDIDVVTHIIVDRNINFTIVLKTIQVECVPKSILILNDEWTPDCILLNRIVATSERYQVTGFTAPHFLQTSSEESSHLQGAQALQDKTSLRSLDNSVSDPSTMSPTVAFRESVEDSFRVPNSQRPSDELDAAIMTINRLGSVRLEEELDAVSERDHMLDAETSEKSMVKHWQDKFRCMKPNLVNKEATKSPNDFVISKMQVMQNYYETSNDPGDKWKPRGYRMAISSLRKETRPIHTYDQAIALPNVGNRLAQHIVEIVKTGTLERVENLGADHAILQKFLGIYGVGPTIANSFLQKGYRSLEDLADSEILTTNQRIGVELYKDLNTRIPRSEVYEHRKLIEHEALRVDPQLQIYIMGSYRRGAADCGDIDVLVSRKKIDPTNLARLWQGLLVRLKNLGYLTHALIVCHRKDGMKWQGISRLGKPGCLYRRIDFLLVPWEQRGAALLYFTGNDLFNRSMRLLARKKGFTLNEKALMRGAIRDKENQSKITVGENTGAQTEEEIFQILGVPYRRPEERVIV